VKYRWKEDYVKAANAFWFVNDSQGNTVARCIQFSSLQITGFEAAPTFEITSDNFPMA
jgi:hypothetical protein